MNMIDTINVVSAGKIEDRELFFIKKRQKVGNPLRIITHVDDFALQFLYKGKEAIKIRVDRTSVDLKLQERGQVSNIAIGVKLHDFIIVDQM